jgi:hypothetical protein
MNLTEDELVSHLKTIDTTITKRRISNWRTKRLLPAFDVQGGGRGRGTGRKASHWSQGEKVIAQAVAVHEALSFYPFIEEAYWPLWLLGYDIDIEIARKKLLDEIAQIREVLAEGEGSSESHDDYFFDKAFDLFEALKTYAQNPKLKYTFEQVEQSVQTIANPAYQPDDPLSIEWQFVQQYLSLPVLHDSISKLPADELQQMQKDYCYLLEGLRLPADAYPGALPTEFPQKYWTAGRAGFFFVIFDLAFRKAGYGDFIDQYLPRLPSYVQQYRAGVTFKP